MRFAVALFFFALLGGSIVLLGAPKESSGVSQGKTRSTLMVCLARDLAKFLQEKKFSEEDRKLTLDIWKSFVHNPPLKTVKELQLDIRRNKGPLAVGGEEDKKKLRKSVEEYLVRAKVEGLPTSSNLELEFDLKRCIALKNIFIANNVTSEALDELTRRVIHRIRMTKES